MGSVKKWLLASVLLDLLSMYETSPYFSKWGPYTEYLVYANQYNTNWSAARDFCRKKHSDLATIRSRAENENLKDLGGWIGLHQESEGSAWKWSKEDESVDYFNWAVGGRQHTRFGPGQSRMKSSMVSAV